MEEQEQEEEVAQAIVQPRAAKSHQVESSAKQNNFMMNENDDEVRDLLRNAEDNLDMDPEEREFRKVILEHIRLLKVGDLLKRVDSLVALNELISAFGTQ